MADELDPVTQQFEADTAEYVAAVEDAVATAQEFADATLELTGATQGLADEFYEAGAAAAGLRDGTAEAAAADNALRDSAAETAAVLGHERDEAVEAAAAMRELRDSEVETAASGAAAEAGGISPMVLGILALVAAAFAVAPALLAMGAGIGAFALFAVPTIMQVTGALGDTKAQLDKLPAPIRLAATEFKNLEAEWKSLSAQFAMPVVQLFSQAIGIAETLMEDLVPLAHAGTQAVSILMNALGNGIDSKGFSDFLAMLTKLVVPATQAVTRLAGVILGILGQAITQLGPISVPFVNMLTQMLAAAGPGLVQALRFIAEVVMDIGKAITPLLGPLGTVFGYMANHSDFATFASVIVGLVVALKAWAMIQPVLNGLMAIFDAEADANPIGLIVIAVAALVIGIIELVKHWHDVAEAFDVVRHAAATFGHDIASVFDKIRHDVASAVDAVISWLKGNWPLIVGIFLGPVALAVAELVQHWNTVKKDVTQVIGDVINWLKANWKLILAILLDPMGAAVMEIRQHWTEISAAFAAGWHAVVSFLDGLRHDIASAWDDIRHDEAAAFDALVKDVETAWDNVRHQVAAKVDAIPGDIEKAWDTVRHDAAALGDDVLKQLEAAWNAVYSATSKAVTDVLGFFEKLPGQVVSFLAALPGQMLTVGENVIKGLINGIVNAAAAIPGIMGQLASDVSSYFTDPLKLFSPSLKFFEHGWNTVQGYINGVRANAPQLLAAMRGLGAGVGAQGLGSSLAGGAIAPAIVGGGGVTHTVNVNVNGQGVATSGLMSPQYRQDLQRAVQEVTLQHAQVNPSNGLNPMWGR
jgi:hypothetical protein